MSMSASASVVAGTFSKKLTLLVLTLFVVDYYSGYNALAYYQNAEQLFFAVLTGESATDWNRDALVIVLSSIAFKAFIYFLLFRIFILFFQKAITIIYYLAAAVFAVAVTTIAIAEVDAVYHFWGSFLLLSTIGASAWIVYEETKNNTKASTQSYQAEPEPLIERRLPHHSKSEYISSPLIEGLPAFNYDEHIKKVLKQAGDDYEKVCADILRKEGYRVILHGQIKDKLDKGVDLIAYHAEKDDVLLVQCKNWKQKAITQTDLNDLFTKLQVMRLESNYNDLVKDFITDHPALAGKHDKTHPVLFVPASATFEHQEKHGDKAKSIKALNDLKALGLVFRQVDNQ